MAIANQNPTIKPIDPPMSNVSPASPPPPMPTATPTPPPASPTTPPPPPSVVSTTPQRGKFGKMGKIIATMLGILFLVGGIAAGITLTQRNQDIREKAAGEHCILICHWSTPNCGKYVSPVDCTTQPGTCEQVDECNADESSCSAISVDDDCDGVDKPPPPAPLEFSCEVNFIAPKTACVGEDLNINVNFKFTKIRGNDNRKVWATPNTTLLTLLDSEVTRNQKGEYKITKYKEKWSITDVITPQTIVINAKGQLTTNNPEFRRTTCDGKKTIKFETCTPPAQCTELKVYDTQWNQLTAEELATLEVGQTIRFAVSGTSAEGTIDKAAFFIAGELYQESSQTNEFGEYYVEYTTTDSLSSLNISTLVHHVETDKWY